MKGYVFLFLISLVVIWASFFMVPNTSYCDGPNVIDNIIVDGESTVLNFTCQHGCTMGFCNPNPLFQVTVVVFFVIGLFSLARILS